MLPICGGKAVNFLISKFMLLAIGGWLCGSQACKNNNYYTVMVILTITVDTPLFNHNPMGIYLYIAAYVTSTYNMARFAL